MYLIIINKPFFPYLRMSFCRHYQVVYSLKTGLNVVRMSLQVGIQFFFQLNNYFGLLLMEFFTLSVNGT